MAKIKIRKKATLENFQHATTEIGVFDLQFTNLKVGDEVDVKIIRRIQRAAITILTSFPEN